MYRSILVASDGSPGAGAAVRRAGELAVQSGARVVLVSAYKPVPKARLAAQRVDAPRDARWSMKPREGLDACLEWAHDVLEAAGIDVVAYARAQPPTEALLDVAAAERPDLVILGRPQGQHVMRRSVPDTIAHRLNCDVLTAVQGLQA